MRMLRAAMCAASVVGLAGCQATMNETNFAAAREGIIGSPALYKRHVDQCVATLRRNPKSLEGHVLLTGLPPERAAVVACERITKAYRNGRFTYELYAKSQAGSPDPELIRIFQGR